MKIVWSPIALECVEDIARYIAEDNPGASGRYISTDSRYSHSYATIQYPTIGMTPRDLARTPPDTKKSRHWKFQKN